MESQSTTNGRMKFHTRVCETCKKKFSATISRKSPDCNKCDDEKQEAMNAVARLHTNHENSMWLLQPCDLCGKGCASPWITGRGCIQCKRRALAVFGACRAHDEETPAEKAEKQKARDEFYLQNPEHTEALRILYPHGEETPAEKAQKQQRRDEFYLANPNAKEARDEFNLQKQKRKEALDEVNLQNQRSKEARDKFYLQNQERKEALDKVYLQNPGQKEAVRKHYFANPKEVTKGYTFADVVKYGLKAY